MSEIENINVPVISSEYGLNRYLHDIKKYPILSEEEEHRLAVRFHKEGDVQAAQTLVTSHLRFVANIAMKYKGYGLPIMDIIAEGNIGLMHAVKKFDPKMGFRLSTYSMWWIRASIQDYILKSWSLVKIGTSATHKKLFFNLRKIKNKLLNIHGRDDIANDAQLIANELNVTPEEVMKMDAKMQSAGNYTLNDRAYGDEGSYVEQIDLIQEPGDNQETLVLENDEAKRRSAMLKDAMHHLNEREQDIITQRMLQEKPTTLEDLSQKYSVSRERIRQIENKALNKLRELMLKESN
jgi:RNA polymerase sigma-32 factor